MIAQAEGTEKVSFEAFRKLALALFVGGIVIIIGGITLYLHPLNKRIHFISPKKRNSLGFF